MIDQKDLAIPGEQDIFWNEWRLNPDSTAYNISLAYELKGSLKEERLIASITSLVNAHDIFKIFFLEKNGYLYVQQRKGSDSCVELIDISDNKNNDLSETITSEINQIRQHHFNLEKGPLFKIGLIKSSNIHYFLVLCFHHILVDGLSEQYIIDYISAQYNEHPLSIDQPLSLAHYVDIKQSLLNAMNHSASRRFWKKEVTKIDLEGNEFSPIKSGESINDKSGGYTYFDIGSELVEDLKSLLNKHETTWLCILMAAYVITLHRLSDCEQLTICYATNCRPKEFKKAMGCFINVLPLPITIKGNPTFLDVLNEITQRRSQQKKHQFFPFLEIIKELRNEKGADIQSSLTIGLMQTHIKTTGLMLNGIKINPVIESQNEVIYDLCLEYEFINNAIRCRLNYRKNHFDENIITHFQNYFSQTLRYYLSHSNQSIHDFSLLDDHERQKLLLTWNNTKTRFTFDRSLLELITDHASKIPDKTALIFQNKSLSYEELEIRIAHIGSYLYDHCLPNHVSVIPIILPNNIHRPIAMLSVLKSGSAYVPIDPEYPAQRIATILQDCEPMQLITSVHLQEKINNALALAQLKHVKLLLIEDWEKSPVSTNPLPKIKPENLAYIMYTSGSTGIPKGVKISHRSLSNFLFAMKKLLAFTSNEHFISITPYTFDISGLELYLPLLAGACCVVADDRSANNGNLLSSLIDKYTVNFVQTTPTKWQLLIDTGWHTRQKPTLLCGGEAFPNVLVEKLLARGHQVWNVYGPTETTIWSTAYPLSTPEKLTERSVVPIGKPIANTQVYVLDRYYQPVPVGCVGELYIGGDGVALGYFKRDDLTQERFIVKPTFLEATSFNKNKFRNSSSQSLYKTGDSAKWLPDGNLLCLGRRDYQIKHHGYRIELTEIEAALLTHQDIKQAVVVRKKLLPSNQYHLIAYYTSNDDTKSVLDKDFREYLLEQLPIHCIPNYFYKLRKLPLTSSGKIDRNQLAQSKVVVTENKEINQSNSDSQLKKIWQDVLHVNHIKPESNFFSLGGDSLSAIHIAYNIEKEFSIECSAKNIFDNADFQQLSMWVARQPKKLTQRRIKEIQKTERIFPIPLSSSQKRFWFLSNLSSSGSYNVLLAWKLKGNLNVSNLIKTVNKIRENYEIFRTIYKRNGASLSQYIIPYYPVDIEAELIDQEEIQQKIEKENKTEFFLGKEPPFQVRIFCVSKKYYVLTINMHHIIFDEKSINTLIQKISEYYESISNDNLNLCDSDEIQYADYAIWEKAYFQNVDSSESINYWKDILSQYKAWFLPTDYERSKVTNFEANIYEFEVKNSYIATSLLIAGEYQTTLFVVCLSVIYILLSEFSEEDDLFVWFPISLRDSSELERAIGCFINTLPLRCHISSNISFVELLSHVQENLLDILNHKNVSFDTLTKYFKIFKKNNEYPTLPVLITWENDIDKNKLDFREVEIEQIKTSNFSSKADLHFNFIERKDSIHCRIEYTASLYKEKTIEELSKQFLKIIADFTTNPKKLIRNNNLNKRQTFKKPKNRNDKIFSNAIKYEKVISGDFIENKLINIFEKLLKIEIKNPNDNFFDLGMNSLLLLQAQAEMEKMISLNREIKLIDFFKHPSITDLANYLRNVTNNADDHFTSETIIDSSSKCDSNDIAIIGLSGEFPGAKNIEQFWENLCKGEESITHFTDDQLEQWGVPKSIIKRSNYVKSRGIIENAEYFDAKFFNMSPNEAILTDPQQRLLIEHAWCALEVAGYSTQKYKGCIGVYTGSDESNYVTKILQKNASCLDSADDFQTLIASGNAFLSTKISYKLNLTGPSLNINTACSTGLVVVAVACQQLLDGQCDMAIAGSVSIKQPQQAGYLYQNEGITSSDGHCRAFSRKADGTVPSAGVGAVLLKRLDDAIRDKDHVYAIIKGFHINNDGSNKAGYTAPSITQQARCVSTAIDKAGVNADTLQYVEMHGTGTKLGDPIEIEALTEGFRNTTTRTKFCAIGSVKSNIGHADAAAGMAGLIKTIQALRSKTIPATLHCDQPNDAINFQDSAFYINNKTVPWESINGPRRAGANALGLGGTNAFLVLEESSITEEFENTNAAAHYILPFSAKTPTALSATIENFYNYVVKMVNQRASLDKADFLKDMTHTLQLGRDEFQYRDYVVVDSLSDLTNQLKLKIEASSKEKTNYFKAVKHDIVFFFHGQGAQYKGMGYALYQSEPVFKNAVDDCIHRLADDLKIDLKTLLFPMLGNKNDTEPNIHNTKYTQPVLFCIEYALAKLWGSWGIQPDALIGHSFGEYVAAHIAGIFSLDDILKLVVYRAELISQLPPGKMLAINISADKLRPFLNDKVSIATISSPTLCVISGDEKSIQKFQETLVQKHIVDNRKMRILNTSHAFHSKMMEPAVSNFISFLKTIKINPPEIPIVSNLTGQFSSETDMTTPEYWAKHLVSTVQLSDSVKIALDTFDCPLFITLGPGRELQSLINPHLSNDKRTLHVNTMISASQYKSTQIESERITYQALGKVWSAHTGKIMWDKFPMHLNARRIPLPTYPFERKPYWPVVADKEQSNLSLVSNENLENWFYKPSWQRLEPISSIIRRDFPTISENCWIVFIENDDVGNSLKENLNFQLAKVIYVIPGEEFLKITQQEFSINPSKEADYALLIDDIIDLKKKSYYVLNFWSYEKDNNLNRIDDTLCKSFYHLFYLSKVFSDKVTQHNIYILNVATELFSVFEEDTISPAMASSTAIPEVIPFERPNVKIKSLDITNYKEIDIPTLVKATLFEIACLMDENEPMYVAYRKGYRWKKEFINVNFNIKIPHTTKSSILSNEGVYIIIGGLSGIGLEIAKKLILDQSLRVVLLSRRSIPDKHLWNNWLSEHSPDDKNFDLIRTLNEMQSHGGNFDVISADITLFESMKMAVEKINQEIGSIKGIIHSAGIAGSGLIANKSKQDIEKVLSSKLQGAYVLSKLFRNNPLDFVLFFSSITSVTGGIGQLEYCAANACLDSLPNANLFHKNTRVLIINWNRWKNTGMAAFSELKKHSGFPENYEDVINNNSITTDQGYELFSKAIDSFENQLIVSKFPLKDYKKMLMHEARQFFEPSSSTSKKIIAGNLEKAEDRLIALFKNLLGLNTLDVNDSFFDFGGHSLLALQLLDEIKKEFGVALLIADVYQAKSIKHLIDLITNKQSKTVSTSYIVPMKRSGSEPPLFLIHPVGGAVFCYIDLIKMLKYDGPIYAIQDPGLTSENYKFTTLENMAAFYLKDIQSICPDGPYRLAGFSLGGTIAFEMAHQLAKKGFPVDYLGLIDSWAVFYDHDKDEFEKSMKRQLKLFKSDLEKIGHSNFTSLLPCQLSRMKLLKKYKPKPVTLELRLYKAKECLPQYLTIQEKNNHWEQYTYSGIQTVIIPGNHETILKKQNVPFLADSMNQHLLLITHSKDPIQN